MVDRSGAKQNSAYDPREARMLESPRASFLPLEKSTGRWSQFNHSENTSMRLEGTGTDEGISTEEPKASVLVVVLLERRRGVRV